MTKFYRVKKDTFLWKEGAIIKHNSSRGSVGGYDAIEDIWDMTPETNQEYISTKIIEHEANSEFFERVYPDSISGKFYRTKDQLISSYKDSFNK